MNDKKQLTRSAGLISAITFISRITGFVRDMIVAMIFGAKDVADAFYMAFRISNLLRELFAEGSMSAAFIPVFTEYLHLKSPEEARKLASSLFNIVLIILSCLTLLGIIFTPEIVNVIAHGFVSQPDKFNLTVYLTRIMFPYMLFVGLAAITMGMLNSMGEFSVPAFSSVMLNLSMIFFTLVVAPYLEQPIVAQAIGVTVGGMLQLGIQIPPLLKKGMGFSLLINIGNEGVRRVGKLAIPVIGSQAVAQLNIFFSSFFASYLAVGSVSYIYYATRLYQFPHGIFGIAIATAILPAMSLEAAKKDYSALRDTLSFGIRLIFFINLPALIGLIVLNVPITSFLFQRGIFDYTATVGTAQVLTFYALGLWAFSGVRIVNSAFYSIQDTRTPVMGAFIAIALNIALSYALMGPLQARGLALANSLSSAFNMTMLLYIFRKRMGRIGLRRISVSIFKSACGSAALAAASYAVCFHLLPADIWTQSGHTMTKGMYLSAAITAGVAAYALVLHITRSEELYFFIDTFKVRLRKRG